jgi:NADH dehydrogenase [ubiquinone] 1 alpha subcomplex assembly factor 1
MKLIIAYLLIILPAKEFIKFDFGSENGNTNDWFALTDNVMGGVSTSKLNYKATSLEFTGNISFQNNGGFASMRSNFGLYDLSAYTHVTIRFKSDKQKFALTFENSKSWWEPNYKYEFQSEQSTDWKTVTFKLMDFHEEILGRKTGKSIDNEILKKISRIGIITNDKKEGPFSIEIDYIEFSGEKK